MITQHNSPIERNIYIRSGKQASTPTFEKRVDQTQSLLIWAILALMFGIDFMMIFAQSLN